MKKEFIALAIIIFLYSCNGKFEVNGTITNNTAKMIYLEEIPVATMQPARVDSAILEKDGKYTLRSRSKEATVYNLRLDQGVYPIAAVINDASRITVNATLSKENNLFAEEYEVKGSVASKQMKDFMYDFNNKLQVIFYEERTADSLQKAGTSDSVLITLQKERIKIATDLRDMTLRAINESGNPALTMFELGYYQSTANNPAFKIEPLDNYEVVKIVNEVAAKFPSHKGVELVKTSLNGQMQKPSAMVGKQAPEINLPDVNGQEVKLSSFKGKYVLIDFWASWCGPCRRENPNIVATYNKCKDKNFTILGVSLDDEKDAWLKAIHNDGLTWTQVSELRNWDSKVVSLYQFDVIPHNVLIDPGGTIIAEDLQGPLLEAKLAEVLK